MKKRGQILDGTIASLIIIISIIGAIFVVSEGSKVYVGNYKELTFFDFSECGNEVSKMNQEDLVVFQSKDQAEKSGFTQIKCQK